MWKIHRREHKRYNKVLEGLGENRTKREKDKGKKKRPKLEDSWKETECSPKDMEIVSRGWCYRI